MELKKTLIALAALLTIGLVCIVPVSAEQVVVNANIAPSFSMSMNTDTVTFPLSIVGTNDLTTSNVVAANSNVPFTIKAKDGFGDGRFKGLLTPGDIPDGKSIAAPLQVALNGGSYVSLSGADQNILSSPAGAFSQPLKLRQVTTYADEVLPAGHVYRVAVIVTGAANP